MMPKTYIIDPASTEWNRGSFCYMPYLFYDGLTHERKEVVCFLENCTLPDLEQIQKEDNVYVAFWSPTQKDLCLEIHRLLPQALYFGYWGFIIEYGLPVYPIGKKEIMEGMKHQGKSFGLFQKVLLSDCDSHIQGEFKGKFYPFHSAYGCPKNCSFCPSSKNNDGRYFRLPRQEIFDKLDFYELYDYTNIHFTDEDFFLNPDGAACILSWCSLSKKQYNLIALTHVETIQKYIKKYGLDTIKKANMRLLEIGFEGEVLKDEKGEDHIQKCIELHKQLGDITFWLTMTFAPGETIESIYKTGLFLKKYGKNPEDLLPRLRTNGTEGGLGQFFQSYPDLQQNLKGIHSPFNPTRLFPSFIPKSFLESKIKKIDKTRWDDYVTWCNLYHVVPTDFLSHGSVENILNRMDADSWIEVGETCISIALAARIGIIQ